MTPKRTVDLIFTRTNLKIWIGSDGKASADEKAQHTGEYVSILKRQITPPSGVRHVYEMGSK